MALNKKKFNKLFIRLTFSIAHIIVLLFITFLTIFHIYNLLLTVIIERKHEIARHILKYSLVDCPQSPIFRKDRRDRALCVTAAILVSKVPGDGGRAPGVYSGREIEERKYPPNRPPSPK